MHEITELVVCKYIYMYMYMYDENITKVIRV